MQVAGANPAIFAWWSPDLANISFSLADSFTASALASGVSAARRHARRNCEELTKTQRRRGTAND